MTDKIKKFIKAATVRAIRTVAQTAIASIGVSATLGDVQWGAVLSTAALAGLLSVLNSIVTGLPEVPEEEEEESK